MSDDIGLTIYIENDTAEELGIVKKELDSINYQAVRQFRRTLQLGLLTLQVMGVAVDETMRIWAEVIAISIESALSIRAAQAAGGVGAARVVLTSIQIIILVNQLIAIKRGRAELAARFGAAEQALKLATF